VIYCKSGHRGAIAAATLRLLGYTDVRNLGGGVGAWTKAELPLETGEVTALTAGTAPVVDTTTLHDLDAFLAGLPEGFYSVKPADLNAELGSATAPFLLDVRTAEELAADGTIEGAVNIPIIELMGKLDLLPTDKAAPVVVFCKSGHRGAFVLQALRMMGYSEVRNLAGGMNAWAAAELPVVK